MEKKNFGLNSDICDMRNIKDGVFDGYEAIYINSDVVIQNERAKEIIAKYPVTLNADTIIQVPEDKVVDLQVENGVKVISGNGVPVNDVILIVNGVLRIEEGCVDALQKYVKIIVNGSVRYCEELQPYLTNMIVNGTSNVYPSGCVLLNKTEQLDKYFPIKAREGAIYYVEKKIIILDESFDVDKLLEKKVSFTTTKLVIRENLLEKMLPLFPANVELVVIPMGVAYVPEDAVIDDIFIKQFGNKIFIDGNAKIVETAIPYLSQLDYLEVVNEISITNNLLDAFLEYSFQYGSLKVQKGKIIDKKISLTIDNEFLEKNPEGVIVRKSALVKIASEVSNEDILTLLQFEYCASIQCSEEQKSAVEMISSNVANIGDDLSSSNVKSKLGDVVKNISNMVFSNVDIYTF